MDIMFRKRVVKNIRRAKLSDASDDEDSEHVKNNQSVLSSDSKKNGTKSKIGVGDQGGSSSILSSRPANDVSALNESPSVTPVASSSSLLSFADDVEEGEVFKVKKSGQSKRRADRLRRLEAEALSSDPPRGMYDNVQDTRSRADFIHGDNGRLEKQHSMFTSCTNENRGRQSPDSVSSWTLDKAKVEQIDSVVVLSGNDLEEHEKHVEPVIRKFKDVLQSGAIPDAKMIHLARKRRQQARETGEVILLDDTQRFQEERSRLIREDDNDLSDGEEGGQFVGVRDLREQERQQTRDEFLTAEQGDVDSGEEHDEDFERWEQEQIKKAIPTQQILSMQSYQSAAYYGSPYGGAVGFNDTKHTLRLSPMRDIKDPAPMDVDLDVELVGEELNAGSRQPKLGGGPVLPPSAGRRAQTLESIRNRLQERLEVARSGVRSTELERDKVQDHLIDNQASLNQLDGTAPRLSDEYKFYQEMRVYSLNLLDCLNAKMSRIAELEKTMTDLLRSKAHFLVSRRQQDVKDQFEECSVAASGKSLLLQQDADRNIRVAEREARRTRRRQAREKTMAGLAYHDGLSSDDEEAPSRLVHFTSERDKIISASTDVFADAEDEFSSTEEICRRFFEWQDRQPESFKKAYINMCVQKVLAPLVSLQLLGWNPLQSGCLSLESMSWFESLLFYEGRAVSTRSDMFVSGQHSLAEDDPIFCLIPALIEKVVCPKLAEYVELLWDPLSRSQCERLSSTIRDLIRDYPSMKGDSSNVESLFTRLVSRMRRSLDDDLFIPIYPKNIIENKSTGAYAFLDRQFWACLKMMRNFLCFHGVLSNNTLQEFVIDGVLNRYVVLGLQCGILTDAAALTKVKSVVDVLLDKKLTCTAQKRQFEPFCKVLVRLVDEVVQIAANSSTEKSNARDTTTAVVNWLTQLGATDHASKVLEMSKGKL